MNYKNIALGIVIVSIIVAAVFFLFGKSKVTPPQGLIDVNIQKEEKPEVDTLKDGDSHKEVEGNDEDNDVNKALEDEGNDKVDEDGKTERLRIHEKEQEIKDKKAEEVEVERAEKVESELDLLKKQLEEAEKISEEESNEEDPTENPTENSVQDVSELKNQIRLKKDELEYPPLVNP